MGKYKQISLSKGAKLYYVKNNISKSTMVRICFDCGSRCDTIPGLAHFTEHMFFTGTKTMTRDEINKKYFDFIGSNAATTSGDIYFDANLFTKEFEEYIKTVATMITESTFKQKEIDKECGIIQQEIARSKDQFGRMAHRNNKLNITGMSYYKDFGSLGTQESVAKIKTRDIKNYVKKYFVSNNCHIFVASQLSARKVKSIIEKHLISKLNFDSNFKALPYYVDYIKNAQFKNHEYKDINKTYIFVNFKHNHSISDFPFRAKATLVCDMINEFSTGIMKLMREEKSLVYSGGFSNYIMNDKESLTTFSTECDSKNVNAVIETLKEYINNIKQNGFSKSQLKQAKRMHKYNHDTSEPRVGRLMYRLSDFERYGRILKNDILKITKKVTLEECNETFKEMFFTKDVSMSVYGDIKKEELISDKKFDELFIK